MIELPLVCLAGILGSSHCIGMCGPFALTIGTAAPSRWENLRRQTVYSAGRIFTYATLRSLAGFGGLRLAGAASVLVNLPALLAIVAGCLLIYQGLVTAGLLGPKTPAAHQGPCLPATFFGAFLGKSSRQHLFLAGMFTGMLPCGLVYAFLALAASSASTAQGAATMAAFGLGTVPVMMLTGFSGSLLSLAARRWMFRLAAWCVVLAGAISIARGAGFLQLTASEPAGCPLCPTDLPLPGDLSK